MQRDEFIGHVQQRAQLRSRDDAERLTRATLETLGERVPGGTVTNLAGQLPQEIGEHLLRTVTMGDAGTGELFGGQEFVQRVADRAIVRESDAAYGARVVLEVLEEATTGGLVGTIREALPPDIRQLLEAGSPGNPST